MVLVQTGQIVNTQKKLNRQIQIFPQLSLIAKKTLTLVTFGK